MEGTVAARRTCPSAGRPHRRWTVPDPSATRPASACQPSRVTEAHRREPRRPPSPRPGALLLLVALLGAAGVGGEAVDPADPAVAASRLLDLGSEKEAVQAIREWAQRPPGERNALYEAVVAVARAELDGGGDGEEGRALYLLCGSRRCSPAPGVARAPGDAFCPDGSGTRGEEVSSGELLHAPPPEYTSAAYKGRVEGMVTLMACVDRKGHVTDLYVEHGLPLGLSEQAVRTVEEWQFRPARREDERVVAIYRVSVHFQLD